MGFLYQPADGAAADFIPFYKDGQYHLFYLKDYRDPNRHGDGTPWFQIVTRDFVRFEDWGEAIPRGPAGAQDRWIFTGSVLEAEGRYHIFYTGHNGHYQNIGKPVEAVMHATSRDLRTWEKDTSFPMLLPTSGHEMNDWRDPFVFWNNEVGEYWMLLAVRRAGRPGLRGETALLTSKDLKAWLVRDPFWAPDLYYTHECPDLFRMGDWWYLLFSEFSERHTTHYRMSRSLAGPWIAPADEDFDTRAYYAAKTAGDGNRRFLFGWLATRTDDKDSTPWQWGGTLVVHELVQRPDGTLATRMPQGVHAAFSRRLPAIPQPLCGAWDLSGSSLAGRRPDGRCLLTLGDLPDTCLIEATVTLEKGTHGAGLFFQADPSGAGQQHELRLEPHRRRVVVDRHVRWLDTPFVLERPCPVEHGRPTRVKLLLDETRLVAYVNDEVALSARVYQPFGKVFGLFINDGSATFTDVSARTP